MSQSGRRLAHAPHRAAFVLLAALLVSIVSLLPFAIQGVVVDVDQTANPTYSLMADYRNEADTHTHANLAVTDLDEWHRRATIEVAGHHVCAEPCTWTDRLLFVSIPVAREDGEGLPPFSEVDFAPSSLAVTKSVQLPVSGDPIRYPFDEFRLRLGVVMQRVFPDGTIQTLPPQQTDGHLFLSVNGFIPRTVMNKPRPVAMSQVFVDDPTYQYSLVTDLTLVRPLYLRVLTVLLVLLVSAAASYATFMRPLNELVINSGALVLGVWGIRAILLGPNVPGLTLVDLSLMVVILFLLVGITCRALVYLHHRIAPTTEPPG